ncbi:hypothetical protein BC936DRAFT_146903 [Jimgerdemannia flammicorona]|uniref:Uncharacterized protein n=1 Tax=Jimgerdemannia flammicorona TaxID=994334 RepID=A0A433D6N0_9FUNG|nr:hypothetical protein BC936DRAFT_146903 [Jimgerdemannia flammicorona]
MPSGGRSKQDTYPNVHPRREVLQVADLGPDGRSTFAIGLKVHVRVLDDGLVLDDGVQHGEGEPGASIGHREGGAAKPILGLDDLVAAELDSVGDGLDLLPGELVSTLDLREQRENGDATVTANDRDAERVSFGADQARDESRGANNVEGGDTKNPVTNEETM